MRYTEVAEAKAKALEMYRKAAIVLTEAEQEHIEIADFGLGQFYDPYLRFLYTYLQARIVCVFIVLDKSPHSSSQPRLPAKLLATARRYI